LTSEKSILLIEPDENTGKYLAHKLGQAGYAATLVSSGKEGLIAAWRDQPDAIVIEITLADIDSFELIAKLRGDLRTQKTRIIGLVDRGRLGDSRLSTESGLNTYIIKQTDAVDLLLRYLRQHITQPVVEKRSSQTTGSRLSLALIGCKGGSGVSSLCVNLAHTIAFQDRSRSTVVVDLASPIGTLTEMTLADRHTDVVQLCQMEPKALGPTYLRQNLPVPRQWGFYLVPGTIKPWQYREITKNQLGGLLQSLHAAFDNVILDLGHNLGPLEFLAMDFSSQVALIFTPDEIGVRSALIYRQDILRHGLKPDSILHVTNRPIATESMSVVALEDALGRAPDLTLPHLGGDMHLTISQHTPYPLRFPDESGSRQMERFARDLIEQEYSSSSIPIDPLPSDATH
jgi:Flp pilus assembly CpaE family ATPase